jgi:hypothetical protein
VSTLGERWQGLWDRIRQGPSRLPSRIAIPRGNVDRPAGAALRRGESYFQVRVNELYLAAGRQWFSQYDPLVFAVSEFTYDKRSEAVPYVVGPALLERFGQKLPAGMVFADTRVAGPHPYRGGRLALSVVLCRVRRGDYARRMLQLIEAAAAALDFSAALTAYVKVARVAVDGVEALLGLGDTDPLLGARTEMDPDAGDALESGYFAIIDRPEAEVDRGRLWVRENHLVQGAGLADAVPYRESDYVLYSVVQATERTDENMLPFYPLVEQVRQEAARPDEESWKRAKANMLTLFQALALSPDLTAGQANALSDRYIAEMKDLHTRAARLDTMGGPTFDKAFAKPVDAESMETQVRLRDAVKILDL